MQRNAQHALSAELTADVVELLPVVSEPLRVEMHFELYTGFLSHHPMFNDYIREAPMVMRRVCHFGMSTSLLSEGDVIFGKGETPTESMYFVCRGMMEYDLDNEGDLQNVSEKQWVSEPALWCQGWVHRGTLKSTTEAKLHLLNVSTFQEIVSRAKDSVSQELKVYAADFVEKLNSSGEISDLTAPPLGLKPGPVVKAKVRGQGSKLF